jgi:RNA polymerase sigma-70 factor, ECF subfamily
MIATALPRGSAAADTESFQEVRPRLFGIAYRMLGSAAEADDVVQETWLRWHRSDRSTVRDAAAFLATTTTRLALNVLQSARARRETCAARAFPERFDPSDDPALVAERGEALALALGALLARLSPAERAAYLLREAFDYPHRQIAQVLGVSEANARQLVARARLHLAGEPRRPVGAGELRRLVEAFARAAETGELAPLERLLSPCHEIAHLSGLG